MKKTKKQFIEDFLNFWDYQACYEFDYPSLDIYFEDDSLMKMFIAPVHWDMMELDIPKVSFCYVDDNYTIETSGFAPAMHPEKSLESLFEEWFDILYNKYGIDISTKMIGKVYENILTK